MKPAYPRDLSCLFTKQHEPLIRYFLRRTAHTWDAQDLVQEVYVRLLAAERDSEKPIRNPEAYLYTIAVNLLKRRAEIAIRQRNTVGSEGLEAILQCHATPCEAAVGLDRELRLQRLRELIERLSPKCRAVLMLHYRDELGYREIAERLQLSTHMVKKYIVKGLASCRHGMARYE